jgi:lysophospholipase L1-like esterase
MTKILIFGDSIIWGACDTEGGWVQRLRKYFDENWSEKFDYSVYNLGIPGNTTEDLLERFEFETKQRLKENEDIMFIFGIGINDSQFIHSKNGLRYSLEEFEGNIQKLVDLARKYSSSITFVGLTPVDDSKTNEYVKQFDKKIKEVCEKNNINYIYMFDKLDLNDLEEDGLHPDNEGHNKMFKVIKENLKLS